MIQVRCKVYDSRTLYMCHTNYIVHVTYKVHCICVIQSALYMCHTKYIVHVSYKVRCTCVIQSTLYMWHTKYVVHVNMWNVLLWRTLVQCIFHERFQVYFCMTHQMHLALIRLHNFINIILNNILYMCPTQYIVHVSYKGHCTCVIQITLYMWHTKYIAYVSYKVHCQLVQSTLYGICKKSFVWHMYI
jgi:hypothetical protein